jgi:hypothetical protein
MLQQVMENTLEIIGKIECLSKEIEDRRKNEMEI